MENKPLVGSGAVVTTMTKSRLEEERDSLCYTSVLQSMGEELCLLACPASFLRNLPRYGATNSRLGPLTLVSFRWPQARLSNLGNSKAEVPSSQMTLGCVKLQ